MFISHIFPYFLYNSFIRYVKLKERERLDGPRSHNEFHNSGDLNPDLPGPTPALKQLTVTGSLP